MCGHRPDMRRKCVGSTQAEARCMRQQDVVQQSSYVAHCLRRCRSSRANWGRCCRGGGWPGSGGGGVGGEGACPLGACLEPSHRRRCASVRGNRATEEGLPDSNGDRVRRGP